MLIFLQNRQRDCRVISSEPQLELGHVRLRMVLYKPFSD